MDPASLFLGGNANKAIPSSALTGLELIQDHVDAIPPKLILTTGSSPLTAADRTDSPVAGAGMKINGNTDTMTAAYAIGQLVHARELFELGLLADSRHGPLYHAYGNMELVSVLSSVI